MFMWDTYSNVKPLYNEYQGKTKGVLRDDGKIIGVVGDTDGLAILLGNAYFKGWIEGGWYVTDAYHVVAATMDSDGIIHYQISRYTSIEDAGTAYDYLYITEDGASGKALINNNSVVVESSRKGATLAVGYYFLQMGFPELQTLQ